MKLTTDRLEIVPLTAIELVLLIEDISALESKLKCSYEAEPVEGFFADILKSQAEITRQDPENYLWHSFWLIIRRSDRVVVGSADFKNMPDEKGEVEIGYGLGKQHEHNGYMTETVKAMCTWALAQKGVDSVIAETYIEGFASQRILKRCGFEETGRGETIWWKLKKS